MPTDVAPLAAARNKTSINIKIVIEIYMKAEKSMASWTITASKLI